MLVVYGALLAAVGQDARLPGSVWTVCLVWICAQAAAFVAAKVLLLPAGELLLKPMHTRVLMLSAVCRLGCHLLLVW